MFCLSEVTSYFRVIVVGNYYRPYYEAPTSFCIVLRIMTNTITRDEHERRMKIIGDECSSLVTIEG